MPSHHSDVESEDKLLSNASSLEGNSELELPASDALQPMLLQQRSEEVLSVSYFYVCVDVK